MEAVNQSVIRSIDNIEKNILALQEEDEARFFSLIAKQSDSTELNEGNFFVYGKITKKVSFNSN